MNRKVWTTVIFALFLIAASACLKHGSASQLIVEIPFGLNGNFLLERGVKETARLVMQGDADVVTVPRNGKMTTSLLTNSQLTFRNSSEGAVGSYSQFVSKIEFFGGTRKEFEAEQARKKHSGGILIPAESIAAGI
jgi:hypothetical protein